MMSFIGSDCLDWLRQYPKAQDAVLAPALGARPAPAPAGRRQPTPSLDGKRDAHPARPGLDPAGAAARLRARHVGEARRSRRCACVALVGFFVYPTYPTYDSFYALLWGRDLLHAHLPDFRVYRGPTEHPLAIVFGVLLLDLRRRAARA